MSAPGFFGPMGSAPPSPRPSPDRALYFSWFQLADQGKRGGHEGLESGAEDTRTAVPTPFKPSRGFVAPPLTAPPHAPILRADRDGRVTGPDAVEFFGRSGLPRDQLAKVWAFADNTRRGYLDFEAFTRALELISMAQHTGEVSLDGYSAQQAIGIIPPRMVGLPASAPATPPSATAAGAGGANPFAPAGDGPSVMAVPPSPPSVGAPPPMFYFGGPSAMPAELQPSPQASTAPPDMFPPPPGAPPGAKAREGQPLGAGRRRAPMTTKDVTSVTDGLRKIYFNKIRPLEELYKFGHFFSPLLSEGDFEAKPSVLLLGQYSTGKTTFIKYLLGRDYPGLHIGPEPTTDRFVVVMHGPEDRRTPGNTLVVQTDKPFTGLGQFGNGFLSKFEAATCENRLLEEVTLVDTPGVLSGEKQRIERSYDFIQVCGWFAARCDLILLLFDPYKLDISDEFKAVISTLRGHDDKVRVVLNKADQVDQQQLMRVYGALMWSLGKVFRSPEVCRVYIGSFNAGAPIREDVNPGGRALFEKEQEDLLHDLYDIPARSCDRKVNEFVKRVRAARIHFLIMGHLRKQMPYFGQKKAQDKLLANLPAEFAQVQREHHLHPGDFPDVDRYREILSAFDISKFPKLDKAMIKQVDDALAIDVPQLVRAMSNPYL